MILYLAISIWPIVCCFIHRRCSFFLEEKAIRISERIWVAIAMLPMFVVLAFRNKSMGPDTGTYWEAYRFAANNSLSVLFLTQKMEPGYLFVEFLFAKIIPDPSAFQVLYVIFYFFAIYSFVIKNGKEKFLIIFLICTLGLFKFFFTGIRQCISMCICLLSFESVKKKQPFKFFAIVLISSLFHTSSLLFGIVYFVYYFKHTIKNLIIYFLVCLISFATTLFLFPYVSGLLGYGNYVLEFAGNGFLRFGFLALLFMIFFLDKTNKIISDDNFENGVFNVSLIFLLFWGLRLVTRTAERLTLYFLPFYAVFVSSKIKRVLGENTKESFIVLIICCLALLLLFLHSVNSDGLIPYRTF